MASAAPVEAPVRSPVRETGVEERLAPRWKVILLNDDVTTFAFVVEMLVALFGKSAEEAWRIAEEVHSTGAGLVTVTSQERAELYLEQIRAMARPRGFPLAAAMEPE